MCNFLGSQINFLRPNADQIFFRFITQIDAHIAAFAWLKAYVTEYGS